MPLMRDWTEITVDEGLLSQVVRELLELADDPNHVEVVYGTSGRIILADVDLAERWFEAATKKSEEETNIEVTGHGLEVFANEEVDEAEAASSTSDLYAKDPGPLPIKRGPGRPRKNPLPFSASDGEES